VIKDWKKILEIIELNTMKGLTKCETIDQVNLLFRTELGKKGQLKALMNEALKSTSIEEKKVLMPLINQTKQKLIDELNKKRTLIEQELIKEQLKERTILPGELNISPYKGYVHPNSVLINKINKFLWKNNYTLVEHSPLELSEYNFEKLNISKNHPAFKNNDTFFIDEEKKYLLRAHCTSTTSRLLELKANQLFAAYTIGNVFRRDTDDATHSHQFMQLDLIKITKNSSIWEFQNFLFQFVSFVLGREVTIRFRPSYFPFTSPSFELDVKCGCGGACSICKGTGWIEILGAGMIHENVFKKTGYSIKKVQDNNIVGWAFGMGIDRLTCILHNIPDVRMLYENRLAFLEHFKENN